jgi:hypothetical protein
MINKIKFNILYKFKKQNKVALKNNKKMQNVSNYRKNNCQRYLEQIKINSKWTLYIKKVINKQIKIY